MQVFLIGFMGAGKTSFGKQLAEAVNLNFIDMDEVIEAEQKKTIPQIFKEEGEEHFRSLEKDWLERFDQKNVLVALGGGTPCRPGIMQMLRERGVTVYLKVDPAELVNRLAEIDKTRPLIAGIVHDKDALTEYVERKLKEREEYYLKAHIIFDNSTASPEQKALLKELVQIKLTYL